MIDENAHIYLFDNTNELLISKPSFSALKNTSYHAVAYNEGFIYLIGGYDQKNQKTLK